MGFQVAIDGPGGSGKSTVAKTAAEQLGFIYIDTGAMYRAVGYYALSKGVDPSDENSVCALLPEIEISILRDKNGYQVVILNRHDVTMQLRSREAGDAASKVAVYRAVREKLVCLQRTLAEDGNVIMDGRDIGTDVLKNADIKIYMDADAGIRAERRYGELQKLNLPCDYDIIINEIIMRDERDKNREISPLKKADDAIVIDTGNMTIEEAVSKVVEMVKERRGSCFQSSGNGKRTEN